MAVRSWRCGSTADIIDIDMAVIDTAIIYGRISMQGGRDRAADRRSRWLPLGAIPGNACKSTVPVIDEYIVPINDGEHAWPRHRQIAPRHGPPHLAGYWVKASPAATAGCGQGRRTEIHYHVRQSG